MRCTETWFRNWLWIFNFLLKVLIETEILMALGTARVEKKEIKA